MKVELIEESPVKKALAIEIESDVVEQEIETRARQYARQVKIPGFRPGKIPPAVIKQRFRHQVMEDVVEALVNRTVHQELDNRGLRPLATPTVTELKVDENQPLSFKASFETLPEIEVPEFRDLPVKTRQPAVGEHEVDLEIDRLREQAARYDAVEGRPLREGDFAVLDVSFKKEDGDTQNDQNVLVEVGAQENHKDLNTALIGMAPGDQKDVTLVYDDKHPSEGLAGKTVHYSLTLKGVKDKVVPAADDEFAKDLGQFDSLQELRADIKKQLVTAEERKIDREVKGRIVEALLQRASFEVPEALVLRHMNARMENAVRSLAMQGVDPRTTGIDWKEYRESQRAESREAARADILLDALARKQKVEVTEEEVDAELERYAERVRKPKEAVRAKMEKEGDLSGLRARIREDKTLDLLKANARMEFE